MSCSGQAISAYEPNHSGITRLWNLPEEKDKKKKSTMSHVFSQAFSNPPIIIGINRDTKGRPL